MKYNYIAIEGNIGAGKTTLAKKIASHLNYKTLLENFEDNPFLVKFYEDPKKHVFPMELAFMTERSNQLKKEFGLLDISKNPIVSDYIIHKSLVFAENNLSKKEFELFAKIFKTMSQSLPQPDLIIYLELSTDQLKRNILKRGREYEKNIGDKYLALIHDSYIELLKQIKKKSRIVKIDLTKFDATNQEKLFQYILSIMRQKLPLGITKISAAQWT
jgi:deoxyguanosine kinase